MVEDDGDWGYSKTMRMMKVGSQGRWIGGRTLGGEEGDSEGWVSAKGYEKRIRMMV